METRCPTLPLSLIHIYGLVGDLFQVVPELTSAL